MMNSKHLSTTLLILSFLAFVDSAYLTIEHYSSLVPPCTLGGCEKVLTSSYAVVLGIPTSLWGMLYALFVFFLVLVFRHEPNRRRAVLLVYILGAGLVGALGLVYLQAFVLHAFCQYCLIFEAIIVAMFLTSLWQLRGNSI